MNKLFVGFLTILLLASLALFIYDGGVDANKKIEERLQDGWEGAKFEDTLSIKMECTNDTDWKNNSPDLTMLPNFGFGITYLVNGEVVDNETFYSYINSELKEEIKKLDKSQLNEEVKK
jgi:hypothetical protein